MIEPQGPVLSVLRGRERPYAEADLPRLKQITRLLPVLKRKRVGRFARLPMEYVVQTANYEERDRALLELFDRGRLAAYTLFWRTGYFRNQHHYKGRSVVATSRRVNRYFRLFRSIRQQGLYSDPERVEELAWVFCAETTCFRMDGHHRIAAARYLGYQEVPVMAVTPRDLLALTETPRDHDLDLDPDLIGYLEGLEEPSYLPARRS